MKQLLDFIPLVIFFILFKVYDIYIGVTGLMIASTVALIITWIIYKKIEKVALFAYLMIIIFGALTLYFRNPDFIKWKVTIIYFIFAIILLASQLIFKKPLLQKLLGKELNLPTQIWNKLNFSWVIFFIVCALANLYITYSMSQEFWVTFKTFILPGITLVFTILSGIYIYKQIDKNSSQA
ncbi:septation protein A [Zophobihabitans entericus]|uniref:Inner membrane-spanning protein YciB n=1 Tax=Zophobihabitans entericus TaxID=1635327 RepID=A0A6G9IBL0_9GAMM|nr:septation protein A [Zophobihabitans entericus]QIQ21618.1 septation protein A [Zophobihabitans entericus]